jgi:Tol biopolymer transport system component
LTNHEIARRLGISPDGVKYHVSEIIAKLGVADRYEAARWREAPAARPFAALHAAGLLISKAGASTAGRLAFGGLALASIVAIGVLAWGLVTVERGPLELNFEPGVYLVDADGSGLRRVTEDAYVCQTQCGPPYALLAWSPDGSELLINDGFGAKEGLLIAAAGGQILRTLDVQPWRAVWLESGNVGVYAGVGEEPDRREVLAVVNSVTGARSVVAEGFAGLISPDGRYAVTTDATPSRGLAILDIDNGQVVRVPGENFTFEAWAADSSVFAVNAVGDEPDALVVYTVDGHERMRTRAGRQPVWSPDGRLIATTATEVVEDVERPRVLITDAGTGATRVLTSGYGPTFSPDGKTVAFLRAGQLWRIGLDGKREQLLVETVVPEITEAAWSPDGRSIAVVAAGDSRIYEMNADGSGERLIAVGSGVQVSPDGRLAFVYRGGVYVMEPRDREVVRVGEMNFSDALGSCMSARRVRWSPDGKSLAFGSDDSVRSGRSLLPGIYVWDGSTTRLLTAGYGPEWRPDGMSVAYTSRGPLCTVRLIDADGSNDREFLPAGMDPDWSPEGRYVAYRTGAQGALSGEMVVTTADQQRELLRLGPGRGFTWSPDGTRFAFLRLPVTRPSSPPPGATAVLAPLPPDTEAVLAIARVGAAAPPIQVSVSQDTGFQWAPDGSGLLVSTRPDSRSQASIYFLDPANPADLRFITQGRAAAWSHDGRTIFVTR